MNIETVDPARVAKMAKVVEQIEALALDNFGDARVPAMAGVLVRLAREMNMDRDTLLSGVRGIWDDMERTHARRPTQPGGAA